VSYIFLIIFFNCLIAGKDTNNSSEPNMEETKAPEADRQQTQEEIEEEENKTPFKFQISLKLADLHEDAFRDIQSVCSFFEKALKDRRMKEDPDSVFFLLNFCYNLEPKIFDYNRFFSIFQMKILIESFQKEIKRKNSSISYLLNLLITLGFKQNIINSDNITKLENIDLRFYFLNTYFEQNGGNNNDNLDNVLKWLFPTLFSDYSIYTRFIFFPNIDSFYNSRFIKKIFSAFYPVLKDVFGLEDLKNEEYIYSNTNVLQIDNFYITSDNFSDIFGETPQANLIKLFLSKADTGKVLNETAFNGSSFYQTRSLNSEHENMIVFLLKTFISDNYQDLIIAYRENFKALVDAEKKFEEMIKKRISAKEEKRKNNNQSLEQIKKEEEEDAKAFDEQIAQFLAINELKAELRNKIALQKAQNLIAFSNRSAANESSNESSNRNGNDDDQQKQDSLQFPPQIAAEMKSNESDDDNNHDYDLYAEYAKLIGSKDQNQALLPPSNWIEPSNDDHPEANFMDLNPEDFKKDQKNNQYDDDQEKQDTPVQISTLIGFGAKAQ